MAKEVRRRIIVAITGATGTIYGVRLLQELKLAGVATHLIISRAGALNAAAEFDMSRAQIESLADVVHSERDVGASIASGSFRTHAMVIAPCSARTLAAVATGVTDNLVARAADVTLKERRRLLLLVRETPLHAGHLSNMLSVTQMGGIVFPPVPAFYTKPTTIAEIVDQTIGRVLDLLDVDSTLTRRWEGLRGSGTAEEETPA